MSEPSVELYPTIPASDAVKNVFVLSTCHVPLETERWLCQMETKVGYDDECQKEFPVLLIVDKIEYGHLIYVSEDIACEYQLKAQHPDLFNILIMAHVHGCRWVKFDRDAGRVAGLPQYDW